ncbi:disulfide bond formation protein B, partial [Neisseria sp. P0018.S003]|uniref:disulfide bond formation protein B n=1 Tax=Neisseria sp. P0018.S003 TaxID=3436789 RepID=UPI003F7F2ED3
MNFFRKTVLFLVVLSIFAAYGSFISQYVLGMNPCVLCILQRLCVLGVGLLAIVTAFRSQSSKFARSLSALLIAAPAVYGAGVAASQIWLQSLPPGTAPSCGAPWTFRLRDWPLFDWFAPIVRGFGNCAEQDY